MKRRLIFGASAFAALTGLAAAQPMSGKDAEQILNNATVWYAPLSAMSARQFFNKNSETIYINDAGEKTYGAWMMRGDQYCSVWPPSEHYVCYGLDFDTAASPVKITFISGGNGKPYVGVLKPGKHVDEPWQE